MKIRNLILSFALLLAVSLGANAQGLHYSGIVLGQQAVAASYAMVAVCPAGTTGPPYPCTNPVSIYSNEALTTAAPNPMRADSEARFSFWVASGHYVLEEYGQLQPPRYEDIYVYNGSSGGVTNVSGTANEIGSTGGTTPILSITNPFIFPGKATFAGSTTGAASFNLPAGTAPTSPSAGDMWSLGSGQFQLYDGTNTYNFARVPTSGITVGDCAKFADLIGGLADTACGGGLFSSFEIGSNTAITSTGNYLKFLAGTNVTLGYSGSGTSGSPYQVTINSSASGGSGGIGGGTTNSPGSTDHVVNVINYGAVGVGNSVDDATFPSFGGLWGATGVSTTATTPGGTTHFNNEVVLTVYGMGWSFTGPTGPTNRVNLAFYAGNYDGLWMGDQTVATAGTFTGASGTLGSSQGWEALNIPLIPVTGQTITFVAVATKQQAHIGAITVNVPTGTAAGDLEIACIATYFNSSSGSMYVASGWFPIAQLYGGNTESSTLECMGHVATASEPASYTFSGTTSNYPSAFIATYSNVAALDVQIGSATAGFTSSEVGDVACLHFADPGGRTNTCGPLGAYGSSTVMYPLFGNSSYSDLTSSNLVYASDDTSAFESAISALSSGGTVYIPRGVYGITSSIALPIDKTVNLIGSGDGVLHYSVFSGAHLIVYPSQPPSGSLLLVLSSEMGAAAINIQQNTTNTEFASQDKLEGFSLQAGAGTSGDGGYLNPGGLGATNCNSTYGTCIGDGIDVARPHVVISHVAVSNFSGNDVSITNDSGGNSNYSWNDDIRNNEFSYAGQYGLSISGNGYDNHEILISDNEIIDNNSCGFYASGSHLIGLTVEANDLGWNNLSGANPGAEVCLGNVQGSVWLSNLFETSQQYTYNVMLNSAGIPGPVFRGNTFWFDPWYSEPVFDVTQSNTSLDLSGNFLSQNYGTSSSGWLGGTGTLQNATADSTNFNNTSPGFSTSFSGTGGTANCNISDQGGNLKAACALNSYYETGTAQTWTYPIPFVTTPIVIESGGSCGSYDPSSTATVLTLPSNASMTAETCQVMVMGQD